MSNRPPRRAIEQMILIRMVRLNAIVQGVVVGFLAAAGLFIATNVLIARGGPNVGQHLELLHHYFPGYSVSFVGSLIGAFWAFVVGFCIAYAAAWLYNFLLDWSGRGAESDASRRS